MKREVSIKTSLGDKAAAVPKSMQKGKSRKETSLGDKVAAVSEEQLEMEIKTGDKVAATNPRQSGYFVNQLPCH